MKAVEITRYGGPEVLRLVDRPLPQPGPEDVLVRVAASSVNRPDVAQRMGIYPPPPGVTDIPGLDIAGVVERTGNAVRKWRPGDRVCALVAGGGYAEYCIAPWQQCMPIPEGLGYVEAASLPEVYFTAWNNMMHLGRLGSGRIRTIIQKVFALEQVAEAQSILDANGQLGKVGLVVDPSLVAVERIVH